MMSCSDSQIERQDKSFVSGNMGDVLGKESDDAEGDEVSQEYKECKDLNEDTNTLSNLTEINLVNAEPVDGDVSNSDSNNEPSSHFSKEEDDDDVDGDDDEEEEDDDDDELMDGVLESLSAHLNKNIDADLCFGKEHKNSNNEMSDINTSEDSTGDEDDDICDDEDEDDDDEGDEEDEEDDDEEEDEEEDDKIILEQNFNNSQNQSPTRQLCSCDSCKNYRNPFENDSIEEMRMAQSNWMELRQYIRSVYRIAMENNYMKVHLYQPHVKELVNRLCNRNPHLLFQRLEAQVQEFVIEAKVRQLELLHREKEAPQLSRMFLTGLLDSYKKLMSAATQLAPLLEQLQKVHLDKFNVTWKVLNQHLYQSCVYTDPLVQNNVPLFISELSKCCDENADANKKLVHDFLSFDDEITLVGGMWRDAETRIHQYNQEQATLKAKERMLKEDWKLFKEQRKLFQQKMWNKTISEICDSDGDNDDISLPGHRGCPCDECSMSHIFCGGLVTPPQSPGLTTFTSNHKSSEVVRVNGEGEEVGASATPPAEVPSCECHVCTAPPMNLESDCDNQSGIIVNNNQSGSSPISSPHSIQTGTGSSPGCISGTGGGGGGFHLYPHIHGTGGGGGGSGGASSISLGNSVYPHLYNIHTTLLHHNSISNSSMQPVLPLNSSMVSINGISYRDAMSQMPEVTDVTHSIGTDISTTSVVTTMVSNGHKTVTVDCDTSCNVAAVTKSNCNSTSLTTSKSKGVVTTRPGTPPPPAPRPLGVMRFNGVSSNTNAVATPSVIPKNLVATTSTAPASQHSPSPATQTSVASSASSHQYLLQQLQPPRKIRNCMTQTNPYPQQGQQVVGTSSQPVTSVAQSSASHSDHHSHTGHSRVHQHQSVDSHVSNSKVPQATNGLPPAHSCHKHGEPIKRVSTNDPQAGEDDESASPEDSCSDRSTSTQRDSKHCDCCYCEVFGHGVPSVAPVSRNYQEMRERLRQLLTKKKAKCKAANANNSSATTAPANAHSHSSSTTLPPSNSSSSSSSSSLSAKQLSNSALPNGVSTNSHSSNSSSAAVDVQKDPRDLEDLLDFIEGNPSKYKDAKKAAKKARQKQKKQEELDRKRREEEEAERRKQELIIQQQKQQAALLKKQQQQQKQKQKKEKKKANNNSNNANNNVNNSNNSNNNNKNAPQMVTIKRVMEPNSAEPTVTITLRGATPSEDKVLYTLLNGQVCHIQKDTKNSKGKQQQTSVNNSNNKGKNNNNNNNNNNACNNKNVVQQQNKKNANTNSKNNSKKDNSVHIQMNSHGNSNNSNSNSINNNNSSSSSSSNNNNSKKSNKNSTTTVIKNSSSGGGGNTITTRMLSQSAVQVPPSPPPSTTQLTSPTAIQINNAINRLSSKSNTSNFNLDNLKLPPGITITKVDPSTVQPRRPQQQQQQQQQQARQQAQNVRQAPPPAAPVNVVPPKPAPSNVIVVDTGRLKDLTVLQNELNGGSVGNDDNANGANGKKKKKNKKGNSANGSSNANNRNEVAGVMGNGNRNITLLNGNQPQPQNGKLVMPQTAAIIRVNGSMVTIRSPAFQQALANKTDAVTVTSTNSNVTNDQIKKRRKKKKGANGQGQPDEWNLVDSVFAPKDIDLDNGDMDDAERELEAFKRFCLQSVPPKQKEKVHLNIKDIVLKKKSSAISCV